ncbi:Protein of unknown function [Gryllus bimaculatus]|nr:Protein of unknown function [Gryllus bimaculatus]
MKRTLQTPESEYELEKALSEVNYDVVDLCEIRKCGDAIIEKANGDIFLYIETTKELPLRILNFKDCTERTQEYQSTCEI